jgi:dUTP pyrophosphatase
VIRLAEEAMAMTNKIVKIARLPHAADMSLPSCEGGPVTRLDLMAAVPANSPLIIPPGGRAAIPTGLVFEPSPDLEGQIRSRSGLALHHGVAVLNSPGTLDADYRGELHVILANFGADPFTVTRGAKIALLVFSPVARTNLVEVARLEDIRPSERGPRGFGSTGR